MNTQLIKEKNLKYTYDIVFTEDEKNNFYDEAINHVNENTAIDGFRRGKAPKNLIQERHKDKIENYVSYVAYRNVIPSLVKKNDFLIYDPHYEIVDSEKLKLRVIFELFPSIPELSISPLKNIKKYNVEITDQDINQSIDSQRDYVIKNEIPILGDDVKIAYKASIKGKSIASSYEGTLKNDTFSRIIMTAGNKKQVLSDVVIDETFPEDLALYKKEKINLEIDLQEVKKNNIKEINDDFAVKMGYVSLEDYQKAEKTFLLNLSQYNSMDNVLNQITQCWQKEYNITVPDSLIEYEKKFIQQKLDEDLIKLRVFKRIYLAAAVLQFDLALDNKIRDAIKHKNISLKTYFDIMYGNSNLIIYLGQKKVEFLQKEKVLTEEKISLNEFNKIKNSL